MKTKASLTRTLFPLLMMFILILAIAASAFAGKQDRPIGSFTEIEISSAFKVVLTQGNTEKLTLEADENILDKIITEVRGNKLIIKLENNNIIRNTKEMTVYLTFKELSKISLSGAVNLSGTNAMKFNDLDIDGSGSSKIDLDLTTKKLKLDLSGASTIVLKGTGTSLAADFSGASSLKAEDFKVKSCAIDCSGASSIIVNASEKLRVEGSGASKIKYTGNPAIVETDLSGASKISKI